MSDQINDAASQQLNAPILTFNDEAGNPINEITLAPGEQKKIKVILSNHPEAITQNFLAQWSVYDSNHQFTNSITCVIDSDSKKWLNPLFLSTGDESVGGMNGNDLISARVDNSIWRCMGKNPNGQFWYPRDMFIPPIPVAEFVLMASSDWNDKYATFELDNNITKFVLTTETGTPAANGNTVTCNYSMKLTVNNAKADNVTPPQENSDSVTPPPTPPVNEGDQTPPPTPQTQDREATFVMPKQPTGSNVPLVYFGDATGKPINEISLAPGEEKKIQILLHSCSIKDLQGWQGEWVIYNSNHQPTSLDISCKKTQDGWMTPLNISTNNPSVGGSVFNEYHAWEDEKQPGRWWYTNVNARYTNTIEIGKKFTLPIAIAEFTIKAPRDWFDQFATFEANKANTLFMESSFKGRKRNFWFIDYDMVLTIKNSNPPTGEEKERLERERKEREEKERKEKEEKERKEREEKEREEREAKEKEASDEERRRAIREGLRNTSVDPDMVLYNDTLYNEDKAPDKSFVVSAGECYILHNENKPISKKHIYVRGGGFHNIYPGTIVFADKRLSEGCPIPLANVDRAPIEIYGDFTSGGNTRKTIDASNAANVHDKISELLRELLGSDYRPAGQVDYNKQTYSSKKDMMFGMKVDATFCGSNVTVNADITNNESTFVHDTSHEQNFYTIRLNDNYRNDISKLFGDKVTWEEIKKNSTVNGDLKPLAIITSVTYGRSVHFLREYSSSSFHYKGDQGHKGHSIDVATEQDIAISSTASKVQIISLGDNGAAQQMMTDSGGEEKLKAFSEERIDQALAETSQFSEKNLGVPLSYTIELISGQTPGVPIIPSFDGNTISRTYKRCPGSVQVSVTNKAYCTASEENVKVSIGYMVFTIGTGPDGKPKKNVTGHRTWKKQFRQDGNHAQIGSLILDNGEYLDMETYPKLTIESRGTAVGILGKQWKTNLNKQPIDASTGIINLTLDGNTLKKHVYIHDDSKTKIVGTPDSTTKETT